MQTFGTKIKNLLKTNSKSVILVIVITLLNLFTIFVSLQKNDYSFFSKRALATYTISALITILIVFILYKAKTKSWKLEKTFLFCGLILGVFYVLLIPAGKTPDEASHFWRAYAISEGQIFPSTDSEGNLGFRMPKDFDQAISSSYKRYSSLKNDLFTQPNTEYVTSATPADGYMPLNYMPQVLSIWIGKILHAPIVLMLYLGRLLNMIFCILILYFCIKYIPIMKKIVFLIALFPMSMQLFASVSADGSIICSGIALISFVLYARKTMKHIINNKDILLLLMLCLMLTVSKPIYAFLCLILFWIPKEKFKSNKNKLLIIGLIGIITLFCVLLRAFLSSANGARFDASTQIGYMTTNPFDFLVMLFDNSILNSGKYIDSTIGKNLEWFSVELYTPIIMTFILFFSFLCSEHETNITRGLRIYSFCTFFIIIISTFIIMFIMWTQPGETMIDGVQGRYFLPILLLIPLFCLPSEKPKKRQIVKRNYLIIFATLANVYALSVVLCAHI